MSLIAKNVTHIYNKGLVNEIVAVDDVSFEIGNGEFIGIIGHTGSGKSTLVQHFNGLLKPDSGQIIIDGVDITEKKTSLLQIRKKVGMVFQYPEHQLFEETVEADIAFGPANLGLEKAEVQKRVKDALDMTGLAYDKYAKKSPFFLSGGEKRKVAIAGVIAMKPEILIIDEPTAALDPQAHYEIMEMLFNLKLKQGVTILLVSHNMEDVAEYCDRIFVMNKGKLALQGTPQNVFGEGELLRQMGLGLPAAGEFICRLQAQGADIQGNAVCIADAVKLVTAAIKHDKE